MQTQRSQRCTVRRGNVFLKTEKAYRPFSVLALTIPAAEAAVGKNWLPTVILALAALLVCIWMGTQEIPQWDWLKKLQALAAAFILAKLLDWTHRSWPGTAADYVVPAVLTLLAAYAVQKGSAIRGASVLRYGVYLVLALMAVAGLKQLQLQALTPRAELPDVTLAAVLLLPLLSRRDGNGTIPLNGIAAGAASVLTVGSFSLYEYSRGISLGGAAAHLESLAASAITIGWFAAICFVLDSAKGETGKAGDVWIPALLAYGVYLTGIEIRGEMLAAAELLLWGIIPLFWAVGKKMKKVEKSA